MSPTVTSLPALFERVVEQHGSRVAIDSAHWRPTYAELNTAANRLAHALLGCGAPGDRVAILMHQDAPLIAAMLGVLKAGRIVVVLNPSHPATWLAQLLEDAEPSSIVTDTAHAELATEIAGPGVEIIGFEEQSSRNGINTPPIPIAENETAYLVYTSGSTGRPKGVMKTHRQIIADVRAYADAMELTANDKNALLGSLSHGLANVVVWSALLRGGALCPFPVTVKGVTGLAAWMTEYGVTTYASSASIFRNFMKTLDRETRLHGLRAAWLTSEPVTAEDFRSFQRHCPDGHAFVVTLSSSEAGHIALSRHRPGDSVPDGPLPAGLPSKGAEVLLLDEHGRAVPPGAIGEIVVKSCSLAAGYWRNPKLTLERFSDAEDGSGMRIFRTGDLGRINSDGLLEFLGRNDRRIKIRGNRIDLSEVEDAVRQLPGIAEAAVEAISREGHEALLTGYVVTQSGHAWSPANLRHALRSTLPLQMIPSRFVLLESLPLAPSGKLDRERLRQLSSAREAIDPPQTASEQWMAGLWAEAFGVPDIGRSDDFFDLGGDSLIAAVIAAKVHAACGMQLELRTFAERPTLAALACALEERRHDVTDEPPLAPVPRDQPLPLSLFQELTWKTSRTSKGSATHAVSVGDRMVGPLDRDLLRDCLSDLVRRHEALRTTFAESGGRPVQVIHPPTPVDLPFFDLTGRPDAEAEARRLLEEACSRVVDLSSGPLVRWLLVRVHESEHWLLRAGNHINSDAWSSDILLREMGLLYDAKLQGAPSPLPLVEPLQYADYAVWHRKRMRPGAKDYDRSIAWWKGTLSGAPLVLDLPFVRDRPVSNVTADDGIIPWGVLPETSRRLNAIAQGERATYYIVRLAGYVALLAAITGQHDVVVGAAAANRQRGEVQSMVGFLVNHVLMRFPFDPESTFRQLISVVRDVTFETTAHAELPYPMLRSALMRKGVMMPATDTIFSVIRHREAKGFAGLTITNLNFNHHISNYHFNMNFDEHNESHNCTARFDAGWYDREQVQAVIEAFKRLLDAASLHPDSSMKQLFAMSGIEPRDQPSRIRKAYVVAWRLQQRWRRTREFHS